MGYRKNRKALKIGRGSRKEGNRKKLIGEVVQGRVHSRVTSFGEPDR